MPPTVMLDPTIPPEKLARYRALREQARRTDALRWRATARPEQQPPDDWGRVWYVRGGRGGGKTWTGSNAFAELLLTSPTGEWGVIAPTYGDARDTCVESDESGLIKALGGRCGPNGVLLERGPHIASWNRSMGDLRLTNGSVIYADGADDGALRIQGKNLRGAWCDEVGLWKRWRTAWDESIRYAVRKHPAKIIATGTPKRAMPAIILVKRLLADPKVVTSLLRTEDNAANLDADTLADYLTSKGTALGRQELEGEVLDEAEGALWTRDEQKARDQGLGLIRHGVLPQDGLGRRVLAVDPSDGEEDSDEYGMCVATVDAAGVGYVLHSTGVRLGPDGNVDATARLYEQFECDVVVVEKNHGGGYLPAMLRGKGLPVTVVSASQGKRTRAEPVAARYGPHAPGVVHVGEHDDLETQMTSFTGAPGEVSPDRLDAMVWALTSLLIDGTRKGLRAGFRTLPAA